MKKPLALAALTLALAGCGTVSGNDRQTIEVVTVPAGAACNLVREGQVIAQVPATPGTVEIGKSKHDIQVTCALAGYQQASAVNESEWDSETGIGTGIVGVIFPLAPAIDAMSGASNKYAERVEIRMVPANTMSATTLTGGTMMGAPAE